MQVKYFTNLPSNYYSTCDEVAMPLILPPSPISCSPCELTTTTYNYTCDDVFQPYPTLIMSPPTNAEANGFISDLPVITSPPPPPYFSPQVTTCTAFHQVLPESTYNLSLSQLTTVLQSAGQTIESSGTSCHGLPELALSPFTCSHGLPELALSPGTCSHGLPELALSPEPCILFSDGCVDEEDWDLLRPVSESPAPGI